MGSTRLPAASGYEAQNLGIHAETHTCARGGALTMNRSHDWRATTPVLEKILAEARLFQRAAPNDPAGSLPAGRAARPSEASDLLHLAEEPTLVLRAQPPIDR